MSHYIVRMRQAIPASVLLVPALMLGQAPASAVASAHQASQTTRMVAKTVPSPCHRLYYKGKASGPSQLQLQCKHRTILFKIDGPFHEGTVKYPDADSHGIHVFTVLYTYGEGRILYRTKHKNCSAIRHLADEPAGSAMFYCTAR